MLTLFAMLVCGCGSSAATKKYLEELGPAKNHVADFEAERARVMAPEIKAMPTMGRGKFNQLPALEKSLQTAYEAFGKQQTYMMGHPAPEELRGFYINYLKYLQEEEEYFKSVQSLCIQMHQFWDQNHPADELPSFTQTWLQNEQQMPKKAAQVAEQFKGVEEVYKRYK